MLIIIKELFINDTQILEKTKLTINHTYYTYMYIHIKCLRDVQRYLFLLNSVEKRLDCTKVFTTALSSTHICVYTYILAILKHHLSFLIFLTVLLLHYNLSDWVHVCFYSIICIKLRFHDNSSFYFFHSL